MKGWFAVASISCSVKARLIFFRSIISCLESTFIAYSLSLFFSLTRYTLPTSPLPSILILEKLDGPTSTWRTLIELLEYVLRKAILPGTGGSVKPWESFPYDAVEGFIPLDIWPLEEPEDIVSSESAPCSIELEMGGGKGGIAWAGAKNPFLVAGEDLEPMENRPLALGAEATRRMNREAVAPIDLGLNGPFVRDRGEVGAGMGNDDCDVSGVCGLDLDRVSGRALSDLVCGRDRDEGSVDFEDG